MTATPTLQEYIARTWQAMKAERQLHERVHTHLARYVRPSLVDFFQDGIKSNLIPAIEVLWDDTPIKANETWARGVSSMSHNAATNWFTAKDEDDEVNEDIEASPWYGMVTKDLRVQARKSGYYSAALHRLKDVGAFGYGATYSYEDDNTGKLSFEYVPAPECYYTLTREGLCRIFIRPLNITVAEAEERRIDIEKCSQPVKDAHRDKKENVRFLFLHIVAPVEAFPEGTVQSNHDFVGIYFQPEGQQVVGQHGFHDHPYHVMSWDPIPQSAYPTGIGYITLPEIRNLNAQRKKFDRILDNESDSPTLAPSEAEGKEQARPQAGEMIYGGMNGDGRRLYDQLYQGNQGSRVLTNEIEASRNMINEAWHNQLMLLLANRQMTAQEVASRDEKIIQAMGPFIIPMLACLNNELERLFHARLRAGAYDPLPRVFDENTETKFELDGLLARAAKKLIANGIVMFYTEAMATVGEIDMQALGDLNNMKALQELAEARAIPEGIMPTDDQLKQAREERAQAATQAQAVEAAPQLAKAARDAAGAMTEINNQQDSGVALAP